MVNTLDPMDLKQIITLHIDGFSNRKIGATLGISRNTVNNYIKLIKGSEYSLEKLLCFNHATLYKLFLSHTTTDIDRYDVMMRYFETVNRARNRLGFTFLYHYQQYSVQANNPSFMEHYPRKNTKN